MDSVISYAYRVGIYHYWDGNAGNPIATRTYRRNEKNESDYVWWRMPVVYVRFYPPPLDTNGEEAELRFKLGISGTIENRDGQQDARGGERLYTRPVPDRLSRKSGEGTLTIAEYQLKQALLLQVPDITFDKFEYFVVPAIMFKAVDEAFMAWATSIQLDTN